MINNHLKLYINNFDIVSGAVAEPHTCEGCPCIS